jgi:hypothetical protein
MDIHLARPGGEREGPFSLEQINANLASGKFEDSDYWAWYEGLDSWVPLHQIPGIVNAPAPRPEAITSEPLAAPKGDTHIIHRHKSDTPPENKAPSKLFSGISVQALEQIFVFTNGEGPVAMQSSVTLQLLQEIIGADFAGILNQAPRDVFGRCSVPAQLAEQGRVPASAWRAMSALRPQLIQQAKDGAYRICVRTFETETGQKVAAFLLYNKEKI